MMLVGAAFSLIFIALPLFILFGSYVIFKDYFTVVSMLAFMCMEGYITGFPLCLLLLLPVYKKAMKTYLFNRALYWYRRCFSSNATTNLTVTPKVIVIQMNTTVINR
jgi:hypothetical protein